MCGPLFPFSGAFFFKELWIDWAVTRVFVNSVLGSRGKMYVCDYSCWPIRPFPAKTLMQRFLGTLYYYYVLYYYYIIIICFCFCFFTVYYIIIIMYCYRFLETLYYVTERAELCVMFQSIVHRPILIDVALY